MLLQLVGELDSATKQKWSERIIAELWNANFDVSQVDILVELLSNGDQPEIETKLSDSAKLAIKELRDHEKLALLCSKFERLNDEIDAQVTDVLRRYCQPENMIVDFRNFVDDLNDTNEVPPSDELCMFCIKLVDERIQLCETAAAHESELCTLTGATSREVASSASKAFGTAIKKSQFTRNNGRFIWNRVVALIKTTADGRKSHGHKLWLRWISRTNGLDRDAYFQELVGREIYWKLLLEGITSKNAYEDKKYCLYILTHSLQLLTRNVENKYMVWKMDEIQHYTTHWKRFITLVEIVAIDTSLNQTVDSVGDLMHILSEGVIPSSWAVGLVSSGLRATMDSVRKYMCSFVLALEESQLRAFADEMEFVCTVLLPHAMQSSYWSVQYTEDETPFCTHAENLTSFVSRFASTLDDTKLNAFISGVFVHFRENMYIYDPARIYVTRGIARGIQGRYILDLQNIEHIHRLANLRTETPIRGRAIALYLVSILLHAEIGDFNCEGWLVALNALLMSNDHLVVPEMTARLARVVQKYGLLEKLDRSQSLDISIQAEIHMNLGDEKWLDKLTFRQKCHIIMDKLPESQDYLCKNASEEFIDQLKSKVHETWFYHCQVAEQLSKYRDIDWGWFTCNLMMHDFDHFAAWLRTLRLMPTAAVASQSGLWQIAHAQLGGFFSPESTRSRDTALIELYRTTKHMIEKSNTFDLNVHDFFGLIDEHYESSSVKLKIAIFECLQVVVAHAKKFDAPLLSEVLLSMWADLVDDRLVLIERPMHLAFIDAAFCKALVNIDDFDLENALEEIANGIIEQSYGRRSLAPHLTRTLYSSKFKPWICRVFAHAYTFQQLDDTVFRLEPVIATTIDNSLAKEGIEIDSYIETYHYHEKASRLHAMAYIVGIPQEFKADLFGHILESDRYKLAWKSRNAGEYESYRVQVFHLLLATEDSLDESTARKVLKNTLSPMLDLEPSPAVRLYVEWIIARILCRIPDQIGETVFPELDSVEGPPRLLCSYSRIGLLVGRQFKRAQSAERASDFYRQYLIRVIPLATTNRSVVRHNSVAMLYALSTEYHTFSDEFKAYIGDLLTVVERVSQTARAAESFNNFRSGDRTVWDIEADFTLTGICGAVIRRSMDRRVFGITEKEWRSEFEELKFPIGHEDDDLWTKLSAVSLEKGTKTSVSTQLQTKSGLWDATIDPTDEEGRQVEVDRGDLIVVASLVDKAPNLGGICRLSDVLGAGLLCLNDMHVTKNREFKAVAVTAEKWMPMKEVKTEDIISFLHEKKRDGFTLIGLEQTDKSVTLNNDLNFPKKSLILLGREKDGIPGDLLAELDFCVEIKQVGVIRSMNIQTATAVIVHAYAAQHC